MPPNLKEEVELDLLLQLEMAARQGDVMGGFNYPNIDWAEGTAYSLKARNFLNVLQDNIKPQLVDSMTRNYALLDLLIRNDTNLIADVEIRDNLN